MQLVEPITTKLVAETGRQIPSSVQPVHPWLTQCPFQHTHPYLLVLQASNLEKLCLRNLSGLGLHRAWVLTRCGCEHKQEAVARLGRQANEGKTLPGSLTAVVKHCTYHFLFPSAMIQVLIRHTFPLRFLLAFGFYLSPVLATSQWL